MMSRNMLLAGIVLVLLNVAALAPMATGAVEGAVEDNFSFLLQGQRLRQRRLYRSRGRLGQFHLPSRLLRLSITNVANVMANGSAPVYEKIGPVAYDITTTRTILDYDRCCR